jgi:hypothetical protein
VALAIVVLTPVARGLAVAMGMPIVDTVYVYSWFRSDGLALGALLAMWIRSSCVSPRNNYRFADILFVVVIVLTTAGILFGALQAKTVPGTAVRITQAQICFASHLLIALTLQGTRLTAILRRPLMRLSGAFRCRGRLSVLNALFQTETGCTVRRDRCDRRTWVVHRHGVVWHSDALKKVSGGAVFALEAVVPGYSVCLTRKATH